VVLEDFHLVPLAVGQATDTQVSQVLEMLWGGHETVIVISSDLSHYCAPDAAQRIDRATADAIESLSPEAIEEGMACGGRPIRGLLGAARQHHLEVRTLDLRNSGDTAGPRDRVVGYGAFALAASGEVDSRLV
jgi:MEMO1 family protein